jgi:rod shape-determining protein MreD
VTRWVAVAGLITAALVQVTWAQALSVVGAFPNLVLLLVVCLTWNGGVRSGMLWACAGGVVLDLTAPGPIGTHALALVAGAYVTGFWVRNLTATNLHQPVLATAAATVVYSLILIGSDDTLGLPVPPFGLAVELIAVSALYNAALMLPAQVLWRRFQPARRQPA